MKKTAFILSLLFFYISTLAQFSERQKLFPANGEESDEFGNYVIIHNNNLIIGAYYSDYEAPQGGTVYYYTYDGSQWTLQQQITSNGEVMADDHFGSTLAAYNDWLMITANADDTNGYYEVGSVYFYQLQNNQWIKRQKVCYNELNDDDNFGWAIDIYDTIALIGAPGYLSNKGAVFVYTYDGTQWNYNTTIQSSDIAFNDNFGAALSFDGSNLIVGAPGKNSSTGAAYIFHFDGSQWTEIQKLIASNAETDDYFGSQTKLKQNTAIIGAYGKNSNTGALYVFNFNGNNWQQNTILTPGDISNGNYFAQNISFDGNTIIAGAWGQNNMQGAAYIFVNNNGQWIQSQKLQASDGEYNDRFGFSTDISGGIAAIGAHYDSPVNQYSGSVYVFTTPPPTITQQPNSQEACNGDTVIFSISAQNADTYQWQKDGINLSDNSHYIGTSTNQLQIINVSNDDNGNYTCVVSNSSGSVNSNTATLTTYTPITAYAGEDIQTCEQQITLNANDPSPGDGQWSIISGYAQIDTPYSNHTTATIGIGTTILRWSITNGACITYDDITIYNNSVVIEQQPQNLTAQEGETVQFTVIANSAVNITYQWYKNENYIENGTTNTLTISNVSQTDEGDYYCIIIPTSICPEVSTDTVNLTVVPTYIKQNNSIKVYPNPTKDFINIVPISNNLKITLYDQTGKKIIENQINRATKINLPHKGIYFLEIQNNSSIKTIKLIRK